MTPEVKVALIAAAGVVGNWLTHYWTVVPKLKHITELTNSTLSEARAEIAALKDEVKALIAKKKKS